MFELFFFDVAWFCNLGTMKIVISAGVFVDSAVSMFLFRKYEDHKKKHEENRKQAEEIQFVRHPQNLFKFYFYCVHNGVHVRVCVINI